MQWQHALLALFGAPALHAVGTDLVFAALTKSVGTRVVRSTLAA